MLNLEKNINLQSRFEYVLVPMHKLTAHKLIKENLIYVKEICDLPKEILNNRFFFNIKLQGENEIKTIEIYGSNYSSIINNNFKIINIKIKFLLNYYAASKEYQKLNNKIILNNNLDIL